MSSVFEIKDRYLEVNAMMDDPDIDPEVVMDTLEAIEGELEEKADQYARIIRNAEYDLAAHKAEAKNQQNRASSLEKKIARMKQNLKYVMEETGKTKFKTELFSFGIQKNKASVVIDDWKLLPHDFLKVQDPVPDKTAIYEALKDGFELNGAHLEQTTSLRIR